MGDRQAVALGVRDRTGQTQHVMSMVKYSETGHEPRFFEVELVEPSKREGLLNIVWQAGPTLANQLYDLTETQRKP